MRTQLVMIASLIEILHLVMIPLNLSPLYRTFIVFFSAFILPGALFLILTSSTQNISIFRLLVEGFFISTIISSLIPILFLLTSIPINTVTCSLVNFLLIISLILILSLSHKDISVDIDKVDCFLLFIFLIVFIYLLYFFYNSPRFFTPDETLYLYSAKLLLSNTPISPVIDPTFSFFKILFWGRIVWVSQIAFFVALTTLPINSAYLFGIYFFVMLAITPAIFFDKKTEKEYTVAAFTITITLPIFLSFSGLVLNDLAVSFYIFNGLVYFSDSFSRDAIFKFSFNLRKFFQSIVFFIFLSLIKPNLLFFIPMWIFLVYLFLIYYFKMHTKKYVVFSQPAEYIYIKVLILLPIAYELSIDIPFFISSWILQNDTLKSFFGRYIIISPLDVLLRIFIPSPYNPTERTMISLSYIDLLDRFYRLISPEANNILTSIIILMSPIIYILYLKKYDLKPKYLILLMIAEISFWIFYLLTSRMFSDISRYSLWIIMVWIVLSIKLIRILIEKPMLLSFVVLSSCILLYQINNMILIIKGGVYVGYIPAKRLDTLHSLMLVIIAVSALTLILSFYVKYHYNKKILCFSTKKFWIIEKKSIKKFTFILLISLSLLSNLYFNYLFFQNNYLYTDHKFVEIANSIVNKTTSNTKSSLVFSNNYLYLRNYYTSSIQKYSNLLPLPDSNKSFTVLLNKAPQNTLFLISNDPDAVWFSYNDRYMMKYADSDVITPETEKIEKYPNITLLSRVLYIPFDDLNKTLVPDKSYYNNFGVNHGVTLTKGLISNAAYFNGSTYISIRNSSLFDIKNSLTISFFALIERTEPHKGHMIVSKGHGYFNGSYSIFVYNTYIYFDLGGVGRLYFSALPYVGAWHHYIFIYNNKKMMAFVDGVLTGVIYASGPIRKSDYPLEIGRDSERGDYFFVGKLDELQISPIAMNATAVASAYFDSYAVRIKTIITPTGNCSIFRLVHETPIVTNVTTDSIKLKKVSLSLLSNDSVSINVQIQNTASVNNITLLAANEKAVRVFTLSLTKGMNNLSFIIPKDQAWTYWYYSTTIRLIIISNGKIISNSVVHLFDLKAVYLATLIILIGLLVCYLLLIDENALKKINSILTRILRKYRS